MGNLHLRQQDDDLGNVSESGDREAGSTQFLIQKNRFWSNDFDKVVCTTVQ